ncbi:MAG TPA: hypothetical protein VEU55_08185 [Gemmatimonadales bacterium]|nr:hypothetical protein [Gemmatimonadales bacterium]
MSGKRLALCGVVVSALAMAGCPSGGLLTEIPARGGGGGSGSDRLQFTLQPSNAAANNIIVPPIQVTVFDTLGTPDSAFTTAVTLSILNNPVGGTLSGTTSVVPFNGVAVFGDLVINKAGTGYTLQASAAGATATSSSAFNIQ